MKNVKFVLTSMIILLFLGITLQSCHKNELNGVVNPTKSVLEKSGDNDRNKGILY